MPLEQSIKETFQSTKILYLALIAGQLMILFIIVVVLNGDQLGNTGFSFGSPFTLIATALFLGMAPMSLFLYKKKVEEGRKMQSLEDKVAQYRASIIIRAALLEGVTLICIVFFMLEPNFLFLIPVAINLLLFSQFFPSPDHFIRDFELSGAEQNELKQQLS